MNGKQEATWEREYSRKYDPNRSNAAEICKKNTRRHDKDAHRPYNNGTKIR
tara:strand:- start:587 stop:739 length:153 start_codon:yes stop_codon:yes gene_type:complete